MGSLYVAERIAAIQAENRIKFAQRPPEPPPAKFQPSGYVYFFVSGTAVKIGFTTNPRQRAHQLKTASPGAAFMAKFLQGTVERERMLHERFAEYRLNGEWFDLKGDLAKYLGRNMKPAQFPKPKVRVIEEERIIDL